MRTAPVPLTLQEDAMYQVAVAAKTGLFLPVEAGTRLRIAG